MRGQPPKLDVLKQHQIDHLLSDAEFYQLNDLVEYIDEFYAMDSLILGRNRNYGKILGEWTGKKWKIQYRGSRDGFAAHQFHSLCDNKGESLFIAEDINGNIFGGYTSVGWQSLQEDNYDRKSFLFTLKNPNNIPPTRYNYSSSTAVYDYSSYLPTFGGGHDMHTSSDCNANDSSYFNFPSSYLDTTGKGKATFTGKSNWRAKDVDFVLDKKLC